MATARSLPMYVRCISRLSGTVLIFLIWFAFWIIYYFFFFRYFVVVAKWSNITLLSAGSDDTTCR